MNVIEDSCEKRSNFQQTSNSTPDSTGTEYFSDTLRFSLVPALLLPRCAACFSSEVLVTAGIRASIHIHLTVV